MQVMTVSAGRPVVQRRYAPKTKTGCITCRIRKVKCDETKPHCNRCTSTGRRCDGYALTCSPNQPTPTLTTALNPAGSINAIEKRTFDFFRLRTAPCLSGYFNDPVWDRHVLQVSQSEPSVRYAVNALGALHEERFLRKTIGNAGVDVPLVRTNFPALQYSKALRGLQSLLGAKSVPMDLVIVCVLLMAHFEALRESFEPAVVHVENAIRLLHASTASDRRTIDPSVVQSLMQLDIQCSLYLGMRAPGLPFFPVATNDELPIAFRNLTEARDFTNAWTCRLLHFMRVDADAYKYREVGGVPLETLAKSQEYVQTLRNIDQLLWDFMRKPAVKLSVHEQYGIGMLRSRVKVNRILSATCLYAEATAYDAFQDVFEDILAICTYILCSDNADRRLISVSLDDGLLQPLTFVAMHCRDSSIRHRALTQLSKLPSKDDPLGVWHVEAMTRSTEVCVRFEEAMCDKASPNCSDIPEWRRVHSVGFDGWNVRNVFERQRAECLLRFRPNGMDGEWEDVCETIEWSVHRPAIPSLKDVGQALTTDTDQLGSRNTHGTRPASPPLDDAVATEPSLYHVALRTHSHG